MNKKFFTLIIILSLFLIFLGIRNTFENANYTELLKILKSDEFVIENSVDNYVIHESDVKKILQDNTTIITIEQYDEYEYLGIINFYRNKYQLYSAELYLPTISENDDNFVIKFKGNIFKISHVDCKYFKSLLKCNAKFY